jgi:hypothetical protein
MINLPTPSPHSSAENASSMLVTRSTSSAPNARHDQLTSEHRELAVTIRIT